MIRFHCLFICVFIKISHQKNYYIIDKYHTDFVETIDKFDKESCSNIDEYIGDHGIEKEVA